jgi:hypothetical protein
MTDDFYDDDPELDERRAGRCQCTGDGYPQGHCPGPANCPLCDDDRDDEGWGDECESIIDELVTNDE